MTLLLIVVVWAAFIVGVLAGLWLAARGCEVDPVDQYTRDRAAMARVVRR